MGYNKNIISSYGDHKDIFLSLINKEGLVRCINVNMIRTSILQNLRLTKTNFFDLLHPANLQGFQKGSSSFQHARAIGLSNIYERARFYNGSVDIQTSPRKGCTLMVIISSSE